MEVETNEDVLETPAEEVEESKTDWEAEAKKQQGINARLSKKIDKMKSAIDEVPKEERQEDTPKPASDKLDEAQLMYLEAKGYESEEQIEFIQKAMNRLGLTAREAIKEPIIKEKLDAIKKEKEIADATPTSSGRTAPISSGKDTVDYWIKKGGIPEDQKLAREVVNKRIELEKRGNKFSTTGLVSNVGQDI